MFRWQVMSSDRLQELAEGMHTEETGEFQIRGSIYADDGTVLAYDIPAYDLVISVSNDVQDRKEFLDHKDEIIKELVKVLGEDNQLINEAFLKDKLKDASALSYLRLIEGITVEKKRLVEKRNYYGVTFEPSSIRNYPNNSLAAHVLGFVGQNEDGEEEGKYGIEGYYSDDLVGKAGVARLESDFTGNVTLEGEYESIKSQESKDITLTIDTSIQAKVEKLLKEGVERYSADLGSVIIMDPETGAIIAMANYPTFNPNQYSKVRDVETYLNNSIADSIESGSVFKPLVIAAALDSNSIDESYICNDDKGYLQIGKWKIHTWDKKADGKLSLGEILAKSNNVCAARVGLEVGEEGIYNYYTKFGIGQFVGINMQGEGNSYMKPFDKWGKADLAVASFGQMVTATNLQVISAHSAIANDGKRMQPYIVAKISNGEDESVYKPFVIADVVSSEVSRKTRELMKYAVDNGEAQYAFRSRKILNYGIAGKTGTALIVDPTSGKYIEGETNTLYVGMAPYQDPKFIMLVRLERPRNRTLSAYNVLPLWADIFNRIKDDFQLVENID